MWNKSPLPLSPLTFTLLACSRLNGTMEQHYQRLILVILSPWGPSPLPVVCKCRSTALWFSGPVVCLDEEFRSRWIIGSGTWACLRAEQTRTVSTFLKWSLSNADVQPADRIQWGVIKCFSIHLFLMHIFNLHIKKSEISLGEMEELVYHKDIMQWNGNRHQICVHGWENCDFLWMNTWNKHRHEFSIMFSPVLRFFWCSFNSIISLQICTIFGGKLDYSVSVVSQQGQKLFIILGNAIHFLAES